MKKLLLSVLAAGLLVIAQAVVGNAPEAYETEVSAAEDRKMPASVIDDISVPYDVTIYVEDEYPGHAIVQADEVFWKGKEVYRLRIDHDSNDYKSRYLFYSKKWKLLDDMSLNTTPPPVKKQPEKDKDDKKDEKQDDQEESEPGRGGQPKPVLDDGDDNDEDEDEDDLEEGEPEDRHERIRRNWRRN